MWYIQVYLKIKMYDLKLFQNSQSRAALWTASFYRLSDIVLTLHKAGFYTGAIFLDR